MLLVGNLLLIRNTAVVDGYVDEERMLINIHAGKKQEERKREEGVERAGFYVIMSEVFILEMSS